MQVSDRIGRRLKLHDLHVLMAVVQAGSMRKAAAFLHTTQPAVSRSIAELEHAFGVRLLDRSAQGVEPTQYGHALLRRGATVFDELKRSGQDIEFLSDPEAGEVRIGTAPGLAATFVAAVIDRLSRRYPRIAIHLVTQPDVNALQRELNERNVDLVIQWRHGPFLDEQFAFEGLFDTSFVVVAGAQHPLARRRRVDFAELLSQPWVLSPPNSPFSLATMNAFRASGLDYPQAMVTAAEVYVRMELLKSGRFLSIFTNSMLSSNRPELKVLPVKLPVAEAPVGIATLKNRTLTPVAQLFIDATREFAKRLAKGKS
ncbi:MAG TPA: LysR family transcriptional regulator [Xanthobacteraceae bacterium]|jgi:DNA-binding transcriptional LysR family regulator|nr:LysR family transcriptional regulator [Xanthobacteraceae bacterium]